jgi:hypothetical protein
MVETDCPRRTLDSLSRGGQVDQVGGALGRWPWVPADSEVQGPHVAVGVITSPTSS